MTKELDKYTISKDTPTAQIVTPSAKRAVNNVLGDGEAGAAPLVTNGERIEEDEDKMNNIHVSKTAGSRREGPQTGAIPKELNNIDKLPKQKLNCTECSETRSSEAPVAAHMSCHREPGMHKCDNRTYKSNENRFLRNHLKHTQHAGTFRKYVCHDCRLEFNSEQEEKNLMENHEQDGATAA